MNFENLNLLNDNFILNYTLFYKANKNHINATIYLISTFSQYKMQIVLKFYTL